jgi:hypothetical protein
MLEDNVILRIKIRVAQSSATLTVTCWSTFHLDTISFDKRNAFVDYTATIFWYQLSERKLVLSKRQPTSMKWYNSTILLISFYQRSIELSWTLILWPRLTQFLGIPTEPNRDRTIFHIASLFC